MMPFPQATEYPPVSEWRESIADVADFTFAEETPEGRVLVVAEREPAGHDAYSVRLNLPSLGWAWDHLGWARQQLRGGLQAVERREGIERRF